LRRGKLKADFVTVQTGVESQQGGERRTVCSFVLMEIEEYAEKGNCARRASLLGRRFRYRKNKIRRMKRERLKNRPSDAGANSVQYRHIVDENEKENDTVADSGTTVAAMPKLTENLRTERRPQYVDSGTRLKIVPTEYREKVRGKTARKKNPS